MQISNNKQKGEVIALQDEPTKTKFSRQAYTYKNKKLRCKKQQTEMLYSLNNNILPVINNITFDSSWVYIVSSIAKIAFFCLVVFVLIE